MSKPIPTNDELDLARAKAIGEAVEGYSPIIPDAWPKSWARWLAAARAIRTADAAMGVVSVPVAELTFARATLAAILSAGHNVPGPTHEDVNKAFWSLDAMLAASPLLEKPDAEG